MRHEMLKETARKTWDASGLLTTLSKSFRGVMKKLSCMVSNSGIFVVNWKVLVPVSLFPVFQSNIWFFNSLHFSWKWRKWFTRGKFSGNAFHIQRRGKLGLVFFPHFFTPTTWKVLTFAFSSKIISLSDFRRFKINFVCNHRTNKCAFILCDVSDKR